MATIRCYGCAGELQSLNLFGHEDHSYCENCATAGGFAPKLSRTTVKNYPSDSSDVVTVVSEWTMSAEFYARERPNALSRIMRAAHDKARSLIPNPDSPKWRFEQPSILLHDDGPYSLRVEVTTEIVSNEFGPPVIVTPEKVTIPTDGDGVVDLSFQIVKQLAPPMISSVPWPKEKALSHFDWAYPQVKGNKIVVNEEGDPKLWEERIGGITRWHQDHFVYTPCQKPLNPVSANTEKKMTNVSPMNTISDLLSFLDKETRALILGRARLTKDGISDKPILVEAQEHMLCEVEAAKVAKTKQAEIDEMMMSEIRATVGSKLREWPSCLLHGLMEVRCYSGVGIVVMDTGNCRENCKPLFLSMTLTPRLRRMLASENWVNPKWRV